MTPSGSQLHNSNSEEEVVTPYWSTISHVLPNLERLFVLKISSKPHLGCPGIVMHLTINERLKDCKTNFNKPI